MLTFLTDVSVLGRDKVSSPFGFFTYCLLTEMVLFWVSRSLQRSDVISPFRKPADPLQIKHGQQSPLIRGVEVGLDIALAVGAFLGH